MNAGFIDLQVWHVASPLSRCAQLFIGRKSSAQFQFQWHGLEPDDSGFVHLSIAEFSL
jgi:hypothetical protein